MITPKRVWRVTFTEASVSHCQISNVKKQAECHSELMYALFVWMGLKTNANTLLKSRFNVWKQVPGSTDSRLKNGWNRRAAHQEYRVRKTNTALSTNLGFHVACGLDVRALSLLPAMLNHRAALEEADGRAAEREHH